MSNLIDTIYSRSPVFIQNLGVSLYGLRIYRREYGSKFLRLLNEFEQRQIGSESDLRAYQNERLRLLIKHSYENVPYYNNTMRAARLTPDDIRTPDDLPKLPVLTRKRVMENFDDLVARNTERADRLVGHTSGTTGSPLRLMWDRQVCLTKTVVDWRQKRMAGLNPGDRIAFFLGRQVAPLSRTKPPFWRHNWVLNHLFCSSFHLSPQNIPHYLDKLAKFGPRALEGYPSTMSILAGFLNQRCQTFPLQAVLTSSETLFKSQREAIEKAFACRVFDFYGMAERVMFATECEEHCGKHVNTDFGLIEIAGEKQIDSGCARLGRIIATGLHNYAMPLIRYETSDVTSLETSPCRCGRVLPLMSGVTTKDEDIAVTPDGRYISSSILNAVTHHLTSIAESQIIQEDRYHVIMRLVPRPSYNAREEAFIIGSLQQVFGPEVQVTVEIVDSIARTASGKFRWVISKVPLKF
jgi:phenylacetate-CoA ligase